MLDGMFTVAESKDGTLGVAGVGPTMRWVNFLVPSAQIEMSHCASSVPGTQAPHIAQNWRSIGPLTVVAEPPRFQTQLGSTELRSVF